MWIGGGRVAAATGDAWIASEDPATEQLLGRVPAGGAADVDRAVSAATAAADGWRLHARERAGRAAARGRGPQRDAP